MDEQVQSPLFRLPSELRHLIYRFVILNGANTQHAFATFSRRNMLTATITRAPCFPVADEEWMKSTFEASNGQVLPSNITLASSGELASCRNGHFPCRKLQLDKKYLLESPVALFLACRRVNQEASPLLYSLNFLYLGHLLLFLESAARATLDRILAIECILQGWMPSKGYGKEFGRGDQDLRKLCGRLANLKSLRRLTLIFNGDKADKIVQTLSERRLEMLSWIKNVDIFEVHIRDRMADEEEMTEARTDKRPFVIWRKREPPWVYGMETLIAEGMAAMDEVRERYSRPVRDG